ncbi:cation:proton antiporter [Actinoplanes sp. NPDC000266]
MIASLVVIAVVTGAWSLVTGRLERWHVRAPLVMVVAGILTGIFTSAFADTLNSTVAQHVAEVILAGTSSTADTPLEALGAAVPSALKAILCGLGLGLLIAWLMNLADARGWTTGQSRRITVVAAPLLAYTATVAIGGNGFVAAFVCGIAFRFLRHVRPRHHVKQRAGTPDLQLLEDTAGSWASTVWRSSPSFASGPCCRHWPVPR